MGLRIYSRSVLYFGFIYWLFGFSAAAGYALHARTFALLAATKATDSSATSDTSATVEPQTTNPPPPAQPLPIPIVKGLNFSLNQTAQHSSVNGWSSTFTPDLSYAFNRHVIVDFSTPWVESYKAYLIGPSGTPATTLTTGTNLLGDSSLSGHYFGNIKRFDEFITGTLGIPTGETAFGLSANQITYNFTNHIDHGISIFTPDIEFGFGDSSSLVKTSAKKSYTAVGPLANFQAGVLTDMPWNTEFDVETYEDLPVGNQSVYGTITRHRHGTTVTTQVLEGTGVAEDNGITAEYDIPVGRHILLSGSYQRSLRQSTDITAVGVTFFLRAPKKTLIQQIADELRLSSY